MVYCNNCPLIGGNDFETQPPPSAVHSIRYLNRRAQTRLAFGARGRGFGARSVRDSALVLKLATLTAVGRCRVSEVDSGCGVNGVDGVDRRAGQGGRSGTTNQKVL